MTGKSYLKQALVEQTKLIAAQRQVVTTSRQMHALLERALTTITTVAEAVTIYHMTERKDLHTLAWVKAVMQLGTAHKDFADLLLIVRCGYQPTQKESDFAGHLAMKRAHIIHNPTLIQVHLLHAMYQEDGWEPKERAQNLLVRLFKQCKDLVELESWHAAYGHLTGGSAKPFWNGYEYSAAMNKLKTAAA